MPVEGPLRDLGMPDLLQLLDISRKTGRLRVTSDAIARDAVVWFEAGRVVHAALGREPAAPEELLVIAGRIGQPDLEHARWFAERQRTPTTALDVLMNAFAIAPREVERQCTEHLENVLFELLSWREGFFSFEETPPSALPPGARMRLSTQSLLMENARRADEWTRIADRVPHLSVVPVLARSGAGGARVELQPREWEVLALVDGKRDLRTIARTMSCPAFEVARLLYTLVTAGIVEAR